MDFDIGNILYIVITIVAVALGLLGKKKKPADGGTGASEGEARPGFMENLERVLQMGQEPVEVTKLQDFEADLPLEGDIEVETVEDSIADQLKRPGIMDDYERIMNKDEEIEYSSEVLEVIDLDELEGTDYFEIVREFYAGTAVVYAAIINRLDY